MSLVENYAVERRARLARLGAVPAPRPAKVVAPKAVQSIDPAPFYRHMWMWDLVNPKPHDAPMPTVLHIRDIVCKYFNLQPMEVESSRRQGALVYPRQVAFYLARNHTNYSYPQIGRRFGNRDHTTIMHGVRRIQERMMADWVVAYDVAHLEAML